MNLNGINDSLLIKLNAPLGDDNLPTFTAKGGVPDIECFYKDFNMICEVTTLSSRDQWYAEGQPVMQHLKDFEDEYNKESYCLFIAPRVHRGTFNTFNLCNKTDFYEGKTLKIIPISITSFVKMLNIINEFKSKNGFKQEQFKSILDYLYNRVITFNTIEDWSKDLNDNIDNIIDII